MKLICLIIIHNIITFFLIWTPSLTSITLASGVMTALDSGKVHSVIYNLHLIGTGSKTRTVQANSFAKCVTLCNFDKKCLSVSYNMADGTCHINKVTLTRRIEAKYDTNYKYTEFAHRDKWRLVFRGTQGIGDSVYEAWNNVGHHDDVTSVTEQEFGCLTVDYRLPCPKHFRSWRLDDFNSNINRVRFVFYTISRVDIRVEFTIGGSKNATESFNMANQRDSSQLKPSGFFGPYNYGSVEGYPTCLRRFYISQNHSGDCMEDYGWMMVSDGWGGPHCCSYESTGPYPQFLYSKYGDAVNWLNTTASMKSKAFAVFFRHNLELGTQWGSSIFAYLLVEPFVTCLNSDQLLDLLNMCGAYLIC